MATLRTAITEAVGPDDIAKADSPSTKMALALAATVPAVVIARRRAANKVARKARRASR